MKGRVRPSRRPNPSGAAQIECCHDFQELVCGGNGSALCARCSVCRLRNVVYYDRGLDKQIFMTERSGVQNSGMYHVTCGRGAGLGDSGCRTSVGGSTWHA